MRIAVEGCAHGELEIIYETILRLEEIEEKKIDVLICCGDFQSTRNLTDLNCMAVPNKFKDMCTFYKYYSGEKIAPVLTIFIGGNHEASNYLQELPYGGWVAPNIYYLGYAGVVTLGGIRIAGISGIYKSHSWMQGHFERPPYTGQTLRSVYHIRNLEIFRLKQVSGNIDIFLSHDWPNGVTKYGNEHGLLKHKPFFREDIANNALGSRPCMELLQHHYPAYWFSAHLHCKFAALVPEENGTRVTKFLALDKCLPKREFLQVVEIDHDDSSPLKLSYDLEWLTILFLTNHLLSIKPGIHYMPGPTGSGRWIFTPSDEEKENILKKFNNDLKIPETFKPMVEVYNPEYPDTPIKQSPKLQINPQTTELCNSLGIDDPGVLLQMVAGNHVETQIDEEPKSCDTPIMEEECNDITNTSMDESSENIIPEDPSAIFYLSNAPSLTTADEEGTEKYVAKDDTSEISVNDCSESGPMEPDCKKFKRRNYSIYSSTF